MEKVRLLLITVVLLMCSVHFAKAQDLKQQRPCPTFGILFSNDTTNIGTCASGPFSMGGLMDSVDVTAGTGIDVHMLQPGLGWVPWWKSEVYPYEEHAEWYRERTGMDIGSYGKRMLQGQDIVGVFVWRCRLRGVSPWISMRMNDNHYKNYVDFSKEGMQEHRGPTSMALDKWYDEHPEYRLGPDPFKGRNLDEVDPDLFKKYSMVLRQANLLNWAIPEVRQRKLAYIEEICRQYDIDGFEMDFKRHPYLFRLEETTKQQRVEIMTEFIKKIRKVLDETAKPNQYRWLGVRIPSRFDEMDDVGVDIPKWHDAGIDVFNLACPDGYHMEQQTDLAAMHKKAPHIPLYLETTYVTGRFNDPDGKMVMLLTTDEQFYTTAYLAYVNGAMGVTSFNFQYYCKWGIPAPYHVFEYMNNPQWLAKQPQHYYLTRYDAKGNRVSKTTFKTASFTLQMAPRVYALSGDELSKEGYKVKRGWSKDGKLRIQVTDPLAFKDNQWSLWFNGTKLMPTKDISDPYPNSYRKDTDRKGKHGRSLQMPVTADTWKAWVVPVELVKEGMNVIKIDKEKEKGEIAYLGLAIE